MTTKKKTANVNVQIAEIERFSNLDTVEAAIAPSIEPATYSPLIHSMIDFVNVTDTIGPSQG
jgi:hypothetical protein